MNNSFIVDKIDNLKCPITSKKLCFYSGSKWNMEQVLKVYLTSKLIRTLVGFIWCLLTLCVHLWQLVQECPQVPWNTSGLSLIGSASFTIITAVNLMSNIWGQRMPTASVFLFGMIGCGINLFASADVLEHTNFRLSKILSLMCGILLGLDAFLVCANDIILKINYKRAMKKYETLDYRISNIFHSKFDQPTTDKALLFVK